MTDINTIIDERIAAALRDRKIALSDLPFSAIKSRLENELELPQIQVQQDIDPWHEIGVGQNPAFENAWVNYNAGFGTAAYYKDPYGVVHLRGLVKLGVIGTNIFTLPLGYRPPAQQLFTVTSNGALGRCDVTTAGGVVSTAGNNLWFSLDGLTFRAA